MNRLQILSTLSFSVLMIGCANKKNISHDIMLHSYTNTYAKIIEVKEKSLC